MSKNDRDELSLEELEAMNGGGFPEDAWDYVKAVLKVVFRLKNQD